MAALRCKFAIPSLLLCIVTWLAIKTEGKQLLTINDNIKEQKQMAFFPQLPLSNSALYYANPYYSPMQGSTSADVSNQNVVVSPNAFISSFPGEFSTSGRNFFGLANLLAPRQCPVCTCPAISPCPTYPKCAKCPTPPAPAKFTTCATEPGTQISAASSGTIEVLSGLTASQTCTYGILAYPPKAGIKVKCTKLDATSATVIKKDGSSGPLTVVAGEISLISPNDVATLKLVTGATGPFAFACSWTATP